MVKEIQFTGAFRIALIFACVQAVMPAIGWGLGYSVAPLISNYDHWVAFFLLLLIGGKMVFESLKKDKEEQTLQLTMSTRTTFIMAIATSIDALIIGVSFALMRMNGTKLLITMLMLAFVTGTAAMLGMLIGKHSGSHFEKKAELAGGILLILIGVKVLLEHTVWA